MANYVYQQIICSKDFFEKYLIDYFPICKNEKMDPPYISFNKLIGVSNLNDYKNMGSIYTMVMVFHKRSKKMEPIW